MAAKQLLLSPFLGRAGGPTPAGGGRRAGGRGRWWVRPRRGAAAKQLLLSPFLGRTGGSTTAEVYGTGSSNPFRGVVSQIVVSPRFGTSYQWLLMEAKQLGGLQEVEGLQILTQS